ncbi:MAG: glycosyltransferase family 2 protein [Actinomycetota bacterium]|nr:glycosyltransferase family 2 protein [Actinomycetota bacterium]
MTLSDLVATLVILGISVASALILRRLEDQIERKSFFVTEKSISFMIPARNEAASISNLLTSIERNFIGRGFEFEVIVADDNSTDDTAAIADSFAFVKVIGVVDRSESTFNGKSNALVAASNSATGDIFVFLDADVVVGPKLQRSISAVAGGFGYDLLSIQPFHRAVGFREGFAVVFNVVSIFSALLSNLSHARPKLAFGPVLITTRDKYLAVGGHLGILNDVVDDVALARRYFEEGLKVLTITDKEVATFRMYPLGFGQLIEGFTKNIVAGASSLSIFAALIGFGYVFAFLTLDVSLFRDLFDQKIISGLIIYTVSTCLVAFGARMVGRFSWTVQLLHPLAFFVFVLVFFRALIRRALSLPNTWKGREV